MKQKVVGFLFILKIKQKKKDLFSIIIIFLILRTVETKCKNFNTIFKKIQFDIHLRHISDK